MESYEHQSERFGLVNIGSLAGVQSALEKLGYDPGKIDGIDGPNTQSAVTAFQNDAGIGADGKVGPITRKALLVALDHAATTEGGTEAAISAAADAVKGILG